MYNTKCFIQNYFDLKKKIQIDLLDFLKNTFYPEINFDLFKKTLEEQKIQRYRQEIEHFFQFFLKIANNTHRTEGFSTKIEQIFAYLTNELKIFSNNELIEMLFENKLILHLLLKNNTITIDETNFRYLFDSKVKELDDGLPSHSHIFYPEIKKFISEEDKKELEDEIIKFENINPDYIEHNEKRTEGEND